MTVTTTSSTSSGTPSISSRFLGKPLGSLLAFGLGVASFPVPALHAGLGTPFGVALIVAGLGGYHVTVNGVTASGGSSSSVA